MLTERADMRVRDDIQIARMGVGVMNRSSRRILAAVALAGAIAPLASPAAAETDADISKYCRAAYPNSAPVKRAPSGAIAHYCNQGGTLQGIDLAKACELTTGSRSYRTLGDRVLCADEPDATRTASGAPIDAAAFVRYCREQFPGSTYQDVPGNAGNRHHCRRVGAGGFTLQPIDLADACRVLKGTSQYRVESGRVSCASAAVGGKTAERRATAAGGKGGDRKTPEAPRPSDSGAGNKDGGDAGKAAAKSGAGKRASDTRPMGTWRMKVGVLPGMKVRFDWSGKFMTATIVELPPKAAQTARAYYGMQVGEAVAVGRLENGTLRIRTRLGVVGTPAWVRARCPASVADYNKAVAEPWSVRGWYPVYQMTFGDGRIVGRHGGNEFIQAKRYPSSRCAFNHAPFTPKLALDRDYLRLSRSGNAGLVDPSILLPKWAVKFELEKVE
jgi:hypothetical protein